MLHLSTRYDKRYNIVLPIKKRKIYYCFDIFDFERLLLHLSFIVGVLF